MIDRWILEEVGTSERVRENTGEREANNKGNLESRVQVIARYIVWEM
jgi:hypothetical protein